MRDALLDVLAFLLWPCVGVLLIWLGRMVFTGELHAVFAALAGAGIIAIAKWMDGP